MDPVRYFMLCCVFLATILLMTACASRTEPPLTSLPVRTVVDPDSLGVDVSREENRPVSLTNRRSAFYYTQTHRNDHTEHVGFSGFNIARRRAFSNYRVNAGGEWLDPAASAVRVYPDRMRRTHPGGIVETLRLVDNRDIVEVEISGGSHPVTVIPEGEGLRELQSVGGLRFFSTMAWPDHVIAAGRHGEHHYLIVAASPAAAQAQFEAAGRQADQWRADRKARIAGLLNGKRYVNADDPMLTRALRWLAVTTDQLVTRQRGDGIYAGLPWFNEYWGRDSFIALPGALLVTGEFETARAVLASFAEFMDMDPDSEFYGRVPNIVRPDKLDYHTTDGTPRFVIALYDYVRYSGDKNLAEELYSKVHASIEGALANWTDENGYLTHAENETWMDARRASDLKAYSPRDTRANDIQALWHGQLRAGVYFAEVVGDSESATRWLHTANSMASCFEQDFTTPERDYLADRLDAVDAADFSLRPNQFYAFDLLSDRAFAARATRTAWQALIYPWGVASLAADDPFFHPYHLAGDHYHKDEAYHNGTVWLWNNGIAIQRMLEFVQVEPAWSLFMNMNRDVLERGVVGGLHENTDAWPRSGMDWPRLTGTYLQAWSNTEQLRVWYQHFLGVRPGLASRRVVLAPRLPANFGTVDFSARVGQGQLRGVYRLEDGTARYNWSLEGSEMRFSIDLPGFDLFGYDLSAGEYLDVEVRGNQLEWAHANASGDTLARGNLSASPDRRAKQAAIDRIFAGIRFAAPGDADVLPVMSRKSSAPKL